MRGKLLVFPALIWYTIPMNTKVHHTIYIGSDHAGFHLKEIALMYLKQRGFDVLDFGSEEYHESDDYPDILHPLALMLSTHPHNTGIVFGGSGTGEAIVLNRYEHVRCVTYTGGDDQTVRLAREHNNANAISFGARFIDEHLLKKTIEIFLSTKFNHELRHERRIEKIESLLAHHTCDYPKK
jgi:ribose 5-phosphate isomerase B